MMRTQIQLTETQHAWLKRWAQRKGISFSEAVRRCVEAALTAEEAASDRRDLVRDAHSVIGKYRHPDKAPHAGRDHDDLLGEAFRK